MNTRKFSTLTIVIMMVFSYVSVSIAEEIVLCISSTDQYVLHVDEKGDCIEGEEQIVISGKGADDLKSLTPLAVFEDYEECENEGSVRKFGFDKNGNNTLDEDEIESVAKFCANAEAKSES